MVDKDIVGQKFGRLTVVLFDSPEKVRGVCECGNTWEGRVYPLLKGYTKSCGCLLNEARRASGRANKKHGMEGTPEYRAWVAMRSRCSNPKHYAFHNYGGRGIDVCDEWAKSFEAFIGDMGLRPGPDYSLDRVDNNLGYFKDNCRWATKREQANNLRHNRAYSFLGETLTISEAADKFSIKYSTLKRRLDSGVAPDDAVKIPVRAWRRGNSEGAPG